MAHHDDNEASRLRAAETAALLGGGEAYYRRLIETSGQGIWIIDTLGDTTFTDAQIGKILDYEPEEMIGRSMYSFMDDEGVREAQRNMDRRQQGIEEQHDFRFQRKDGSDVWTTLAVAPITTKDGAYVGAIGMVADVTWRKQLEGQLRVSLEQAKAYGEELEQKNQALEREIAERNRTEQELRRQQETTRALSAPIIHVWEGVLTLPIIGTLDSARASQIMDKLLQEIARSRARFTVLDLTGADHLDAATANALLNIVRAASLLGSRCVLSGISPAVAHTMVGLGFGMGGLVTFGTLKDALRHAIDELSDGRSHSG